MVILSIPLILLLIIHYYFLNVVISFLREQSGEKICMASMDQLGALGLISLANLFHMDIRRSQESASATDKMCRTLGAFSKAISCFIQQSRKQIIIIFY